MVTMDETMTVAVVLPVYREPICFVDRAIDSIDRQTYRRVELFVVADDPTNQVMLNHLKEKLASLSLQSTLIINETNLGLSNSLNNALSLVRAPYICRMDADDYSHPTRIEHQLDYLLRHNLDLVGCYMNVLSASGELQYKENRLPYLPRAIDQSLRYKNCVMHPTWFGKKEVFELKYRQIPLAEDLDLLMRASLRGFLLGNCPEVLFDYYLSEESISRSDQLRQFLVQQILLDGYKNNDVVSIDDVDNALATRWTERENARYCKAISDLNRLMRSHACSEKISLAAQVACHFMVQRNFRKKILQNLAAISLW